jgi:hypothetical protein
MFHYNCILLTQHTPLWPSTHNYLYHELNLEIDAQTTFLEERKRTNHVLLCGAVTMTHEDRNPATLDSQFSTQLAQ